MTDENTPPAPGAGRDLDLGELVSAGGIWPARFFPEPHGGALDRHLAALIARRPTQIVVAGRDTSGYGVALATRVPGASLAIKPRCSEASLDRVLRIGGLVVSTTGDDTKRLLNPRHVPALLHCDLVVAVDAALVPVLRQRFGPTHEIRVVDVGTPCATGVAAWAFMSTRPIPTGRRRAMATIGIKSMAPVLAESLRTARPYAVRHGYEIVFGDGEADGRPTSWARLPFLRRLLERYDEVLWFDADVVFTQIDRDIGDFVPRDCFHGLVEVRVEEKRHPNLGLWFLRAGERATAFIDELWRRDEFVHHQWWENAAAMDLLGYELSPGRGPIRDSEWMRDTAWLPEEWNTLVGAHGLRPCRVRHYAATPNANRLRWMRVDARSVEGALLGWSPSRRLAHLTEANVRWWDRHVPRSQEELRGKVMRHRRLHHYRTGRLS